MCDTKTKHDKWYNERFTTLNGCAITVSIARLPVEKDAAAGEAAAP